MNKNIEEKLSNFGITFDKDQESSESTIRITNNIEKTENRMEEEERHMQNLENV